MLSNVSEQTGLSVHKPLISGITYDCAPSLNNNKISFRSTTVRCGFPYGKVVDYARQVHLGGCIFRVNQKARDKIIKTGTKGVHAFIRGKLISTSERLRKYDLSSWELVRYDPFMFGFFFLHNDKKKVTGCDEAILIDRTLMVLNPR